MPTPAAAGALNSLLDEFDAGAVAVTGTRRLARYLVEQHALHKRARGGSVWETARAFSWDEWLRSEWRRHTVADTAPDVPMTLLDEHQEQHLWESCIRAGLDPGRDALLQTAATARAVARSWQLLNDWRISLDELRHTQVEDTQAFYRWARMFRERLHAGGWLTGAELAARLAGADVVHDASTILLMGFDGFTPAQQALTAHWRSRGLDVRTVESPESEARARSTVCADRSDEFLRAAQWARARLRAGAAGPIGVVVDDLAHTRDQVARIFQKTLAPRDATAFSADTGTAFHISLGKPLAEYPIAAAALSVLGLLAGARPLVEISRLLHTPFVSGGLSEAPLRARLDLRLRELGWETVSLSGVLGLIERLGSDVPVLGSCLKSAAGFERPRAQSAADWARTFIDWLAVFGWPGNRPLTSAEYQAADAWRELLSRFARLSLVAGGFSLGEAMTRMAYMARQRIFQPRADPVPIQIMGVRESTAMRFSHCWITGMSDDLWPAPPRPDPFLPYALQRRLGLPYSAAELEHERHLKITRRLLHCAGEVWVSAPRRREEQSLSLSPLFADLPPAPPPVVSPDLTAFLQQRRPVLTSIRDPQGPALDTARPVRGGAGIFRDQALCPFRAFAHHRLFARRMPEVESGLDAGERGRLVHQCMEEIWRDLKTQENLLAHSEASLTALIDRHVAGVLASVFRENDNRFQGRFRALEHYRLVTLIHDWMTVERARPPFQVTAVERAIHTRFADMDLKLRIDRTDRYAGGNVIVDYKTGRAAAAWSWFGDRLEEPQLPLYVLVAEDANAIAFAHLRPGTMGYKGLAAGPAFADRGVEAEVDWPGQTGEWRRVLTAIAREFKDGRAQVDPKSSNACASCDAAPLCRIRTRRVMDEDNIGD